MNIFQKIWLWLRGYRKPPARIFQQSRQAPAEMFGETNTSQHSSYAMDAIARVKEKRIWRGQKRLQQVKNGGWVCIGKFEGE